MKPATRTSPIAAELAHLKPRWGEHRGMAVALGTGASPGQSVSLCDTSCLQRWGVKGPAAAAWLSAQGVTTPAGINQWRAIAADAVICRLGGSEFLIEDGWHDEVAARLSQQFKYGTDGVYPVLRQDCAIALTGTRANELLVQICSFNFKALAPGAADVIMTTMTGVGVTVIVQSHNAMPLYRIWCDGTYGPFLWETILAIAKELDGGAAGIDEMFPGARNT